MAKSRTYSGYWCFVNVLGRSHIEKAICSLYPLLWLVKLPKLVFCFLAVHLPRVMQSATGRTLSFTPQPENPTKTYIENTLETCLQSLSSPRLWTRTLWTSVSICFASPLVLHFYPATPATFRISTLANPTICSVSRIPLVFHLLLLFRCIILGRWKCC